MNELMWIKVELVYISDYVIIKFSRIFNLPWVSSTEKKKREARKENLYIYKINSVIWPQKILFFPP